ncbi:MAG: discoidin domain-containing protein [Bacteroidetes bacterium]|nr:discoidin domain-containing protein [Bacteroidota bacterium]
MLTTPLKQNSFLIFCLLLICIYPIHVFCQTNVLTQHNDIKRTGWNNRETILNTTNVKPGSFGKIFTRAVDDQIYAQPLVLTNINMPGVGVKNIVIVATVNNSVYAFDADSASVNTPYWQVSLTPAGTRPPKNTDMVSACGGNYKDFSGNMGIVGTPVIDSTTGTLYLVSRDLVTASSTFQQWLHAIDITTGAEKVNSPKLITATITAGGAGSIGGQLSFDPQRQNQRAGLLLLNDKIFIAWASHCDWGPYHGWVLGYDKTTLLQKYIYNSTPEGYNGGIWMSGSGPAADENGNLYLAVGNGSVGLNGQPADITNRSESALKLTLPASGSLMTVSSFFSPQNIAELEAGDLDFGVTQMMLIPNTTQVMTSCKDGKIYLLDRNNMGGYNAASNNVVQSIDLGVNAHLRSSLTYYKGSQNEFVYSWSENSLLKAFPYNRTTNKFDLNNTISSGTQGPTGNNGALLSVSSNGSIDSTAILWTSYAANGDANQSVRPGILRAFKATDVGATELWNSSLYASDNPGNYAKFNCPTITNGKVYLGTFSNKLIVYGLTNSGTTDSCGIVNLALNKPAVASSLENNTFPASLAFDGNITTRWSSQFADPQSIYVDLGSRFDICRVVLKWETALGKDFSIQVSDDATNWTPLITITSNADAQNDLAVHGSGRYVRMYGTARGTPYGYSLYEFEVYGKQSATNCGAVTGLTAANIYSNNATLQWNAGSAIRYNIQYKTVSAASWNLITTDSNSYHLDGLACGTDYLFQVQAVCNATDSGAYSSPSAFSTLSCDAQCGPLPTRWTTQDVGDVGLAGSACYDNGVFELKGSGNDIWDTQDGFRFAYKTLLGDGEIIARVLSMDQTNVWNKCGIMFRESLTPGSKNVFLAQTSGNGVAFQNRLATDAYSNNFNISDGTVAPHWLKLTKQGSLYTAYHSGDGTNWTKFGDSVDAGFGDGIPVYAGFALTSHDNTVLSDAKIDNYIFAGISEIQIQKFTADLTLNKTVALEWVTSLEMNIKYFIVERSGDNVHYTDIDTVMAQNNGSFTETYNDEDKNPLGGVSYYRLRIVHADGSVSYSAPVWVRNPNSKSPLIYPNPVKGILNIVKGDDPITMISFYDIIGRVVKRIENNTDDIINTPVNSLANGTYIVEIKTATTVFRQKIIVRN